MERHRRHEETRLAYSTGAEKPAPRGDVDPSVEVPPKGIRLRLERRASSRLVTVIAGLPGDPGVLSGLARELKTACGTGGSLKGDSLELQGDQRERVEAALGARGWSWKRAGG